MKNHKHTNRTIKLDKHLIDTIDDILTKYDIKQFVCEGLIYDGICDSDRVYKKRNGKWYSHKCI